MLTFVNVNVEQLLSILTVFMLICCVEGGILYEFF